MSENFYEIVSQHFQKDNNSPCIISNEGVATYADIKDSTGKLAQHLLDCGIKSGERVAVQAEKSLDLLSLYIACLQIGAVYIPVNPGYTDDEVRHLLSDATPSLFVSDPRSLVAAAQDHRPLSHAVSRRRDDPAAILYTSGTTGRSKGAVLSHGNLSSNALALTELWGFTSKDVLLHALPIFHAHGLFISTHCALIAGAALQWLPRFSVEEVIATLPRATVMMGVPTFYTRLLAADQFSREITSGIRLFISGSAPLLSSTFEQFAEKTGHRILERYGMTETLIVSANPLEGERLPGSVGFPLPGVEARVNNEGVLELKGPNIARGYWNRPDLVDEAYTSDGFFVTGDIVEIDATGRFWIRGRAKDLIISGGFNVYPAEIELLLNDLPGVTDSAVIGVPHPDFGEAVIAVVIGTIEENVLLAATRSALASYKIPKRVFYVDEFPVTPLGKVQKAKLRDEFAATFIETGLS